MPRPHGTFGWVDLRVADPAAVAPFYAGVLGWESREVACEGSGTYTMLTSGGDVVAGLGPAIGDRHPTWRSYVIVDDVDEVAGCVPELGGRLVLPPTDVTSGDRMACAADPTGAVFGLWQAGDHLGADAFDRVGTLVWNELRTDDPRSAEAFYSELLGWTWEHVDIGGGRAYGVGHAPRSTSDRGEAGLLGMRGAAPDEPSSRWDAYFGVPDLDVEAVRDLGGVVLAGPGGGVYGRWAYVADPEGASLYLLEPATPL